MENRLQRLKYEDQRAQKMAASAENRADKMLSNRKRHF